MPRTTVLKISMTETRQFQRLVRFLVEVDAVAAINADDELQALVDECRDDLLSRTADEDGAS